MQKLSILVVDDEPDLAAILVRILERAGHHVETALSGQAALALLEERSFDLILSDWRMPGFSGGQLYEEIQRRWPALARHFMLLSGDTVGEDIGSFLAKTHVPYLAKPFLAAQVDVAIQQFIRTLGPQGT